MNQAAHHPSPKALRRQADEAGDPIIAQALRDLAAEYERNEVKKTTVA